MPWTTDDLVSAVRRSGWLPSAGDITAAELLAWGDEEIAETFLEMLKTGREERRIAIEDIALVVGTSRYRLPRRSALETVRGITYLDTSGDECAAQEISPLEAWRYAGERYGSAATLYYFEGDEIVLPVAPTSSGTKLRIRYHMRSSRMVEVSSGARIASAGSTTSLNVANAPAWLTAVSDTAAWADVVRGDSPFPVLYADRKLTAYATLVATLDSSTPVVVAEISSSNSPTGARRDYLCERDCTVYPPIPQEMHGALAWGIVSRALEAQRDTAGSVAARARCTSSIERLRNAAEPRNQDRKPRIIDQGSRLRAGRWGR